MNRPHGHRTCRRPPPPFHSPAGAAPAPPAAELRSLGVARVFQVNKDKYMNITTHHNASSRMKPVRYAILLPTAAAVLLVAFGFYTGEPVFFLKWFFGLQADD